jgi:hypothetical protein
VISVAEIRVGFFLEDIGHEEFVVALVHRLALEADFVETELNFDTRNATGGKGRATTQLRTFIRDVKRERDRLFDLLVIAIDGNCSGYTEKRRELEGIVKRGGYGRAVVYAIPDPHIERWYLADPDALSAALEEPIRPEVPPYKCERGAYKQALREAISQAGIFAPLGGLEYAAEIAENLDLYRVGRADAAFKHLVDELGGALMRLRDITA